MRTIGIICECNPFHSGHEYLFRYARRLGAETVVAIMSGSFVQRGEPAIADRYLRAEAVLCGGADLVVELPFPYSASGAEFFARAGAESLARLGVEAILFGSECGDLARLQAAADICDSEEFQARYAEQIGARSGTAEAYFAVLREMVGETQPLFSNDILGIAYLRALKRIREQYGIALAPVTVKRQGSAYTEAELCANEHPSATALRSLWKEQGLTAVLPHLPACCRAVYARAQEPADLRYAERLILGHFRLSYSEYPEQIAELEGGLGNRMRQIAEQADGLDSFLELSATKKYPMSRLRRGILFSLTGVCRSDLQAAPAYVRLLAANAVGRAFLSSVRKTADICVVTRKTDLPSTSATARQAELEQRAQALWSLCQPQVETSDQLWRIAPKMQ